MVGHYLGVDPGREDDWKSPASAEEVGKQDEEEDAEEGGYQVIGGARSGIPKVVHP